MPANIEDADDLQFIHQYEEPEDGVLIEGEDIDDEDDEDDEISMDLDFAEDMDFDDEIGDIDLDDME